MNGLRGEQRASSEGKRRKRRESGRRSRIRIDVLLRGLASDSYVLPAQARDWSVGGVSVQCAQVYPVGARLRICFQSRLGDAWGEGVVCWLKRLVPSVPGGNGFEMGLKFTSLSAVLKALIQLKGP